ncbi:MAG: tRNA (5-methylaminomethyl-2-thiouridine)(34)-methyltransferase MnmD [Bacteroidota bacterium]|nr:tRNA (5-methylaminomethyl-2-thiouridine)(34)-methyltransferase MnmD [Bacteroidota bacterium]
MKKEIFVTEDGSHTLVIPEIDESYHSTHGAINESKHIFIEAGYKKIDKQIEPLKIFEVGFGTGLNAFLTYHQAVEHKRKVQYVSVEPYPITEELYSKLNYSDALGDAKCGSVFQKMHQVGWDFPFVISDYFVLNKLKAKVQDVEIGEGQFHVIYFDAFSPSTQEEMWSEEIFKKCYDALVEGGVLVTYSAQGQMKRNLKAAGFKVEGLPGPKGKREITRAIKFKNL